MPTLRDNGIRIKRFRELKENLRTNRDRLLVGIDIAKAQHVAQVRLAHTRILDKHLDIPNTRPASTGFWAHLQRRQTRDRAQPRSSAPWSPRGPTTRRSPPSWRPTGSMSSSSRNHVAAPATAGRWMGPGGRAIPRTPTTSATSWSGGCALLLAPGRRVATLRRLVRLLRQARVDLAACKARFRNTLLPALGPAGEPLPSARRREPPRAPARSLLPAGASAGALRRRPGAAPPARPGLRVHRPRGPPGQRAGADRADRGRTRHRRDARSRRTGCS